jgi:UDP-glucose 4-epimerase
MNDGTGKRALVTGGAGFIGSHLCEALGREGWGVTVLDDLSTGRRGNLAGGAKPQALPGAMGVELIVGSVLDEAVVEELVSGCDVVWHLASAVGVKKIIDEPVRTIQTIVKGTEVVLAACRRLGKPVLLTSSSEVYGKSDHVPFAEGDDVVIGPTATRRWVYACAKMLDEFLALAHWHEARAKVVCVRLFNTVGPRQSGQYGMVLPRFVQRALRGQDVEVYGDGKQSRCFCHVLDVVEALVKLATCEAAYGQVINVGSTAEVTIEELARRVIAATSSTSKVVKIPYGEAYVEGFEDMRRRVPAVTKVKGLIGWEARRGLAEIIGDVAAWWGERVKNEE